HEAWKVTPFSWGTPHAAGTPDRAHRCSSLRAQRLVRIDRGRSLWPGCAAPEIATERNWAVKHNLSHFLAIATNRKLACSNSNHARFPCACRKSEPAHFGFARAASALAATY